jgi:hypothetical protein
MKQQQSLVEPRHPVGKSQIVDHPILYKFDKMETS